MNRKSFVVSCQFVVASCLAVALSHDAHAGVTEHASKNTTLTDGLVGLWSFDGPDVSGTTASDRSGNGNTGTLTNGPVVAAGKLGQALSFDGVNDYVSVPDSNSLDLTDAITISAWFYARTITDDGIIAKRDYSGGEIANYQIQLDSSNLYFTFFNGSYRSVNYPSSNIQLNRWYHVVATYDRSNEKLYVNGVLVASVAQTLAMLANSVPVSIGQVVRPINGGGFAPWDGSLDDVRVYNRALGAQEVSDLYQLGAATFQASQNATLTDGLVGLWSFDGPDVSGTTAYDRSGNGNTGTLTNGPVVAAGELGQALSFDGVNDYVDVRSGGSVAFDAVGPSSAGAGGAGPPASPITWSHTCTGSNLVLFVGIAVGRPNATDANITIGAVTYNGVAMTLVPNSLVHSNNQTAGYAVLYYLVNPATGAHTVSVSFTDTLPSATDALELGSISFTGVDQNTPFTNLASSTGASTAPSVAVTSASGNMVLDVVANGSGISSSGKTNRWLKNVNTSSGGGNGAQSTAAGAASVTMSYTVTSDWWAVVGVNVVASGTGPSLSTNSVSFWMKAATGTTQKILDLNGTASLSDVSGTITATSFTSPTIYVDGQVSSTVNDTAWHHVVVTTNTPISTGASPIKLGLIGSTYFGGSLDDVRLYNRALSAQEVSDLYQLGAATFQASQNATLTDGLVGLWSFDGPDVSGTTASDRSGNGNTGTLTNGPVPVAGTLGQGLSFDGVNDWVAVPQSSSINNLNTFTLSLWVYPISDTNNNSPRMLSKSETNTAANGAFNLNDEGGNLNLYANRWATTAGDFQLVTTIIPLKTWTHIAVTYDYGSTSNVPVMYINGTSRAVTVTTAPAGTRGSETEALNIGSNTAATRAFNGSIDDVRLYNRALSAQEVADLYNLGR